MSSPQCHILLTQISSPRNGSFAGSSKTVHSLSTRHASLQGGSLKSLVSTTVKHTSMLQSCASSLFASSSQLLVGLTLIYVNSMYLQHTYMAKLTVRFIWSLLLAMATEALSGSS